MKNVTISLSDNVVKQARIYAAQKSKSLSGLVAELLENLIKDGSQRKQAMDNFIKVGTLFDSDGQKSSREGIYDRKVLR